MRQSRPTVGFLLLLIVPLAVSATQSQVDIWETLLRPQYFPEREIAAGRSVVELRIPARVEDAGVVPISVNAKIAQTSSRYIERAYVFVDKNPKPLAGLSHLTPAMGYSRSRDRRDQRR